MMSAREELLDALRAAMAEVSPGHTLPAAFETPQARPSTATCAVTAAMPLAKRAEAQSAREVAAELIAALRAKTAVERWVESIAVAGPGFINLHLARGARSAIVAEVLADGRRVRQPATRAATPVHGRVRLGQPDRAAARRPRAPGGARRRDLQPARDAGLAACMREFYYNDAGVQIATLGGSRSKARASTGLKPGDPGWPEAAYNGDYIADIAAD